MRRSFTYQLVVRGHVPQGQEEAEAEAKLLQYIAGDVDVMLGIEGSMSGVRVSNITHDEGNFHCFIGPENGKVIISLKRGCSALRWSIDEQHAFARLVANAYRNQRGGPRLRDEQGEAISAVKGPPVPGADGNHPRPAEETTLAPGDDSTVPGRPRHG